MSEQLHQFNIGDVVDNSMAKPGKPFVNHTGYENLVLDEYSNGANHFYSVDSNGKKRQVSQDSILEAYGINPKDSAAHRTDEIEPQVSDARANTKHAKKVREERVALRDRVASHEGLGSVISSDKAALRKLEDNQIENYYGQGSALKKSKERALESLKTEREQADKAAADREIRKQIDAGIEALDYRKNIGPMNDSAEYRIWGNRGRTYIKKDGTPISTVENGMPVLETEGRLAAIRGQAVFGKTSAERKAVADKYEADVLAYVDRGIELSDAEKLVDASLDDEYMNKPQQVERFMQSGLSEKKAVEKTNELYERKAQAREKEIIDREAAADNLIANNNEMLAALGYVDNETAWDLAHSEKDRKETQAQHDAEIKALKDAADKAIQAAKDEKARADTATSRAFAAEGIVAKLTRREKIRRRFAVGALAALALTSAGIGKAFYDNAQTPETQASSASALEHKLQMERDFTNEHGREASAASALEHKLQMERDFTNEQGREASSASALEHKLQMERDFTNEQGRPEAATFKLVEHKTHNDMGTPSGVAYHQMRQAGIKVNSAAMSEAERYILANNGWSAEQAHHLPIGAVVHGLTPDQMAHLKAGAVL